MKKFFDITDGISTDQLLLRLLAAISAGTALLLAAGQGEWGWQWPITTVGLAFLVWATLRPDAEAGLGVIAAVALNATSGHPAMLTATGIGALLLVAHLLWSACSMAPAHGRLGRRLLGTIALIGAGLAAASGAIIWVMASLPQLGRGWAYLVLAVAVISMTAIAIMLLADRTGLAWRGHDATRR